MSRSEINLYNIFKGITPYAIQEIPLIKTAMKIFCQNLEKNAQVSKRISAIFDYDINSADSKHLKKCKKTLKKGLFLMYIGTLYKAVNDMSHDKRIQKTLVKFQYNSAGIYKDVVDIINNEFFSSYRAFSQLVGTKRAIHYLYTFAKYLETGSYEDDLTIEEKVPFLMRYEGSLQKDIFDKIVYNLVHPLGWCYSYVTIMSEMLHDYYGITTTYKIITLELINSKEGRFVVFTDKSTEDVLKDYLKKVNPLTGRNFTEQEFYNQVTVYTGKVLEDYTHWTDARGYQQKLYTFKDDTVLYYDGSTRTFVYTTYLDYLNGFTNPIGEYSSKYILNSKLESDIIFEYYDTFEKIYKEFEVTRYRDYPQRGVGDTVFRRHDSSKMFKVQGAEMQFAQGLDEGICDFTNTDENSGFDLKIKTDISSVIETSDSFFDSDVTNGLLDYAFNTENYHGVWLNATYNTTVDEKSKKFYYKCNILNHAKNIFVDSYIFEPTTYVTKGYDDRLGFQSIDWQNFTHGTFAEPARYTNAYAITVEGHVDILHSQRMKRLPDTFKKLMYTPFETDERLGFQSKDWMNFTHGTFSKLLESGVNRILPTDVRSEYTLFQYDDRLGFQSEDWLNFNHGTFAKPLKAIQYKEKSGTPLQEYNDVYMRFTDADGYSTYFTTSVDPVTKHFVFKDVILYTLPKGNFEISVWYGADVGDTYRIEADHLEILDNCPLLFPDFETQSRETHTVQYLEDVSKKSALWVQDWKLLPDGTDISDHDVYPPKRIRVEEEIVYHSSDPTDYTVETKVYFRTSDMVGELYNPEELLFAEPDKWTADYIKSVDPLVFEDYVFKRTGCIIEGNDYNKFADYYIDEVTFIGVGYKKEYVGTSDFIIMDEEDFVTDDISFVNIGVAGFYLTTSEGYYMYTSDESYMYTSDMNFNSILKI